MPKPKTKFTVSVNYCQCHPETCGCNDWAIFRPDGTKHSTYFHRETADEVANALNRSLQSLSRLRLKKGIEMPLNADPGSPAENTLEYWGNDKVKCPFCDLEFNPGEEDRYELYSEGEHIVDCPGCDRTFRLSTTISHAFSTDKN